MMKIGIITIQRSQLNYGACLQCYALFNRVQKDFGHCEVIDLLRPYLPGYKASPLFPGEMSRRKRIILLRNRIKYLVHRTQKEKLRERRFEEFSNKIEYSKVYKSIKKLYETPPCYDVYVTGSDQVWNPKLPYINEPYFLTFTSENCRRISYASSFGIDEIPVELQSNYCNWLSRYQSISTREDSGAAIIKQLLGKDVPIVLDPVFLLSKDDWREHENNVQGVTPGDYVFLYMLHYDNNVLIKAIQVAKSRNKKLLFVLSQMYRVKYEDAIQLEDIGPAEWMWLIDNADTVVTTSFHGSAFSIIFEKPLVILTQKGAATNTRIDNLTKLLNIKNNVHDIELVEDFSTADFTINNEEISILLKEEIKNSINYLHNAIYEGEN